MKFGKLSAGLFVAVLLFGCGRVRVAHLVDSKNILKCSGLDGMDHVYAAPDIGTIRGSRVLVELLDPAKTLAPGAAADVKQDWNKWHGIIEAAIADALYQSRVFDDVAARSDPEAMPNPDLIFVVGLTEWDRGNPMMRYLLGWGAGRTRMQWEGELRKPGSKQNMMVFADARENPGGPSTFPFGFKALHSDQLLRDDLSWALIDLQSAVRDKTRVVLAPRDRLDPHPKYHPRPFADPRFLSARP